MGVVVSNVVVDGGGELGHTFEDTATNAVGGYFSEPSFNKIEPRRRSRNKMEVKAGMPDRRETGIRWRTKTQERVP
jgi:hypothetical protein